MSFLVAGLLGATTEYNRQLDLQAQEEARRKEAAAAAKQREQELSDQLMQDLALGEIQAGREELAGLQEEQRGLATAQELVDRARNQIPEAERNQYNIYYDGSKVVVELKEEFKPKTGQGSKKPKGPYGPYRAIGEQVDIPGDGFSPEYIRITDQETYATALKNENLVVGEHILPLIYNKTGGSGSFRARDNMRAYTDWLFTDGALEKAQALADAGDTAPLKRLISLGQVYWRDFSLDSQNQYALDEKTRIAPSLVEFDSRYADPRVAGGENSTFFREFVYPSFDTSLFSVEQAAEKLGLPLNQIVDVEVDEEGLPQRITMDTDSYPAFDSWAVQDGQYRPEVVEQVEEIARLSGGVLTPTQVRAAWNDLGAQKGQLLYKTLAEAQQYYSKPENEIVQYNQGRLRFVESNLTAAPFYNKIGTVMSSLDRQPDLKFAFAKAILGEDVINTLPGFQAGGNINRAKLIAQEILPNEKGQAGHSAAATSGERLSTTMTSLIDLIEKEEVYAGVSGGVLIFADGFVAQATNILNQIQPSISDNMSPESRESVEEFLRLRDEVNRQGKNVSAEVMFRALSRAALYDVASMLQGGDFRNISDYDVKLAGDRLGGIFDNFTNLREALPTLRHLRDDSRELMLINRAFAIGEMDEVAAAGIVYSHRISRPRTVSMYLDTIPGAPRNSVDNPIFFGDDVPLPDATVITPDQSKALGFGQ